MNRKILAAVIAVAMVLSTVLMSGCEMVEKDEPAGDIIITSDTESTESEAGSESTDASSDTKESEKDTESKSSDSDKSKDTKSSKEASSKTASSKKTASKAASSKAASSKAASSKAASSKAASSKAASSKAASSKAVSSKAVSSKEESSKSESSKASSDKLTMGEALDIALSNTDYSEDELSSITPITEDGEHFYSISFFRNGTYVFFVREKDKKFFTHEEFDEIYVNLDSDELTDEEALEIVLDNTDYTEDEVSAIVIIEEDGEQFHNVTFFRNGSYTFYVRDRDKKFFTYEDFNETYYHSDGVYNEDDALEIALNSTDYTEDELEGITEEEYDGDDFYAIAFYRNGTYVFYVRQRDGRFYDYYAFNKAYNEYFEGYTGHD